MSTLKTGALRGTSGSADSVQLHASNQSVTFPGAVTITGNATCSGTATGFGGGKIVGIKYAGIGTFNESLGGTGYSNEKECASITYTPVSSSNTILVWNLINIDARPNSYSDRIYMYGRVNNAGAGSSSNVKDANWLIHGEGDHAEAILNLPFMWTATGWTAGSSTTFKLYCHSEGSSGSASDANKVRFHGSGFSVLIEFEN